MLSIINAITPLLILIATGFFLGKFNIISKQGLSGLSRVTFTIFIPSLLFLSIYQSADLSELSLKLLAAFYFPVTLLFFLSDRIFDYFWKDRALKSELFSLASTFSNNILIGIPVLVTFYGDSVLLPGFFIVSIHSLLLFTYTSLCTSFRTPENSSLYRSITASIWLTSRSPIVLSLILGLMLKNVSIILPQFIITPIELLKAAALPSALIVLGCTLSKYKMTEALTPIFTVSLLKLIILPLLIGLSAHYLFNLENKYLIILVIMSASPVGINVFMYAASDSDNSPILASTILVSTLLSLITIPLWLLLLGVA
ncbi:AEC family transporter [Pleionea sediminis]|uniref:AEC family transporter n=1 Tax=Pleionea sediminis TaxID=2569479 RepID=UPI001184CE00|nr:AEC family transporter [Pleionea sediminis]